MSCSLAKWARATKASPGGEIAVHCGLPAASAVLSRYDRWAFVAAATALVLLAHWAKTPHGILHGPPVVAH